MLLENNLRNKLINEKDVKSKINIYNYYIKNNFKCVESNNITYNINI